MKGNDLLRAMNGIEEAFLVSANTASAQPEIKVHHRKTRKSLIMIAAAAVSIGILGITVSGGLIFNRKQAEKYFGEIGAAKLESVSSDAQQTFTNGKIRANVSAVLNDGKKVISLITFEPENPDDKIDWDLEACEAHTAGNPDISLADQHRQVYGDACWMTFVEDLRWLSGGDSFTFRYDKREADLPTKEDIEQCKREGGQVEDLYDNMALIGKESAWYNEYADGLEITIPLTQNVSLIDLTGESGEKFQISGFGLYADRHVYLNKPELTAHFSDGRTKTLFYLPGSVNGSNDENGMTYQFYAKIYEAADGKTFRFNRPENYNGLIDLTGLESLEVDGVTYYVNK